MALTRFKKQLNSSMTPQAMRTFNMHAQKVINAIDEAAEASSLVVNSEADYYAFLDELEGAITATFARLRGDT